MSTILVNQIDHNYHQSCSYEWQDVEEYIRFDSTEDNDISAVGDVNDMPSVEDIPEMMSLTDNELDLIYCQLLDDSSEDQIDSLFDDFIGNDLDENVSNILDINASDGQSMANSLDSLSTSSSVSNHWQQIVGNDSKTSKNNNKRKSVKKAIPKSGKQLRFLFRSLGIEIPKKNKSDVLTPEMFADLKSRLRTRSQTNGGVNRSHRSVESSETVTKSPIDIKTNVRNGRKATTTVTRGECCENSASISYETQIDTEFVQKLYKYTEEMRNNRLKGVDTQPRTQFRRFLPIVRVERIRIESQIDSKLPKKLKKNRNSLLKDNNIRGNGVLEDSPSTTQPVCSYKKRTDRQLRSCQRKKIKFETKPLEKPMKECLVCTQTRPKSNQKLLSTYLKRAFRKPKQQSKCGLRVRYSKQWSRGVSIAFGDVFVLNE